MITMLFYIYSKFKISFALLTLLVVTLSFRTPGYNVTDFWLDELWRVNLFLDPHIVDRYLFSSDSQTAITAPVYLLINKFISLINISPFALRLSSLLPAIGVVILSFLLIRNLGGNLTLSFLVALFFSTNYQFIRYSNELKPYMLEVFVHCACMYYWTRSLFSQTSNNFEYRSLFTVLLISILTTANIIFLLPSIFITLLLKNKNNRPITLYILKFGLLPSLLTVFWCYYFIWSSGADEGMIYFWKDGFANTDDNYLIWIIQKTLDLIKGAFLFSTGVVPNRKYWLFIFLFILYLFIFQRNLIDLKFMKFIFIFYFIFIFILLTLNLLKFWPVGNLRPNLFIYCHIYLAFGYLFISLKKNKLLSWLISLGLIIFITQLTQSNFGVLNHFSPPNEEHNKVWKSFGNTSPLISTIDTECNLNQESVFFLTSSMKYAFNYHLKHDQNNNLPHSIFINDCVKIITLSDMVLYDKNILIKFIEENTKNKQPFWFLYSFVNDENVNKIREVFKQVGHIDTESIFVNAGLFHVVR